MADDARPRTSAGIVVAVCVGPGGIPKHPVDAAQVSEDGLAGDAHRFRLHGGRDRAVCLLGVEEYAALARDGVAVSPPGAFGENLTTEGLDLGALRPGDRLHVGAEVILELFDVREPCGTLKAIDPRFPNLMIGRSGWVARVRSGGTVRRGDPIVRL